jgi:hypothetical protein
MLHAQTTKHILGLTDEALADYVATGVEMYEPEAVEFARQEFTRRNIDSALLAKAEAAVVALRRTYWAQAEQAAVAPTDWADKAIAFVGGMLFPLMRLPLVLWFLRLQGRGEHRKAVQWAIYAAIGAAAMMIFALATVMFQVR